MNQEYKERERYFISIPLQSDKISITELFSMPINYIGTIIEIINEIYEKQKQTK